MNRQTCGGGSTAPTPKPTSLRPFATTACRGSRFENYVGLLDLWGSGGGAAVGLNYPAAPLDIADVLLHLGRKSDAEAVLRDYVGKEHVVGHADVVRTYLLDRGFGDLIDAGG